MAAIVLAAVVPRVAVAEEAETPQYRSLLSEAVAEYDARRYEEARALFRRAHELSPNARTLRGIGMASFELREHVEALRALEGSLVEQHRPLTAAQRQQVEGLLERTRAFVGRFVLHLTPPETALRVDGASVNLEPDGTLLLSFGRHAVTADAPGRMIESRELNVIGGERQELTFRLRTHQSVEPPADTLAVAAPVPTAPAQPAVDLTQKEQPASSSSAAGWFLGAGALAAGTVAGAIWWRERSSAVDQCQAALKDPTKMTCDNPDDLASQRRVAIGVTVGLAVGTAALAIVGVVNLPKSDKSAQKPAESKTAFGCAPEVGGMRCALRMTF